jgi:hypothetical protein
MTDDCGATKRDAHERSVRCEGAMRGRSMRLSVEMACSEERAFSYLALIGRKKREGTFARQFDTPLRPQREGEEALEPGQQQRNVLAYLAACCQAFYANRPVPSLVP